ncbi:MAG: hypothetical protein GY767_14055 [Shimia sp.]|nr:hypothetical protein [Shimia sp.]
MRVRHALAEALNHLTKAEFLNGVQMSTDGLLRLDALLEEVESGVFKLYDSVLEARAILAERLEEREL